MVKGDASLKPATGAFAAQVMEVQVQYSGSPTRRARGSLDAVQTFPDPIAENVGVQPVVNAVGSLRRCLSGKRE